MRNKFKMKGFPTHKGVKRPGPPKMGAHIWDVDSLSDKRVSYDDARAAEEAGKTVTYTNKEYIKRQKEKIANTKDPEHKAYLEEQLADAMRKQKHKSGPHGPGDHKKQIQLDAIAQKEAEGEELTVGQKRRLAMARQEDPTFAGGGTGVLEKPLATEQSLEVHGGGDRDKDAGEGRVESYIDRTSGQQRARDKYATGRDRYASEGPGTDQSHLRDRAAMIKYLRSQPGGYQLSKDEFKAKLRALEEEKTKQQEYLK